jgi:hypothetical protein
VWNIIYNVLVIEFCSGPKHVIFFFFPFLRNFGILSQLLILNLYKWERIGLSKLMNKIKNRVVNFVYGWTVCGQNILKWNRNISDWLTYILALQNKIWKTNHLILTQRLRCADYIDDRKFWSHLISFNNRDMPTILTAKYFDCIQFKFVNGPVAVLVYKVWIRSLILDENVNVRQYISEVTHLTISFYFI